MHYCKTCSAPIGRLTLYSDGKALTGISFAHQRNFTPPQKVIPGDLPVFWAVETWLERYFAGQRPNPADLPLRFSGTRFQKEVWSALLKIPYGTSVTYGELAKQLGTSAQAVGGAIGRNPISIICPCHRVLGTDGKLIGYSGGLDIKTWLLDLEHIPHRSCIKKDL